MDENVCPYGTIEYRGEICQACAACVKFHEDYERSDIYYTDYKRKYIEYYVRKFSEQECKQEYKVEYITRPILKIA